MLVCGRSGYEAACIFVLYWTFGVEIYGIVLKISLLILKCMKNNLHWLLFFACIFFVLFLFFVFVFCGGMHFWNVLTVLNLVLYLQVTGYTWSAGYPLSEKKICSLWNAMKQELPHGYKTSRICPLQPDGSAVPLSSLATSGRKELCQTLLDTKLTISMYHYMMVLKKLTCFI